MSSSDGMLRRLLKKVLVNPKKWIILICFFTMLLVTIGLSCYLAKAEFSNNTNAQEATTCVTTAQQTTFETKPKETESTTKKVLITTTTNQSTTTTFTTPTVTTTTTATTNEDVVIVGQDDWVLNCSYNQEAYEEVYNEQEFYEEVIENSLTDYDYSENRTRPYISSGEYTLASMMANEAGSSDITAIRTGIGFMNRIHNSQFQNGSIEGVYNAGGYCYSTPNEHQQELAAEVISAYNESDQYWSQYCIDHNVTDKTVFHHNGGDPQSWEYPVYVEYGDTGWYQWTMLYSEHNQDHS